jgi:DNA-binding XRE family transcriptional regulator
MHNQPRLSARMLDILMRGVSTRQYKGVIPAMADTIGVSKSSVSRQTIEASEAEVEALQLARGAPKLLHAGRLLRQTSHLRVRYSPPATLPLFDGGV